MKLCALFTDLCQAVRYLATDSYLMFKSTAETLVILHNYKDHQIRLTNSNAQLLAHMPFNA